MHGGNIYEAAPPGEDWLDFSANINPLGLAPGVKRALLTNLEKIVNYPDPRATELRAALGESCRLPAANILPGNGAAELFFLFFRAVKPRRVVIPVPTFSEYEAAARAADCRIAYLPLRPEDGFKPSIAKLKSTLTAEDCLVLANPNNPTGGLLYCSELTEIFSLVKELNAWLLLDESFLEFREECAALTLCREATAYPRLLTVRSLTKFYALPGLRLGFGAANEELLRAMGRQRDPWSVNLLAQAAGTAALKETDYQQETRRLIAAERDFLAAELAKLPGVKIFPPSVNFILLKLLGENTPLLTKLRRQGILVRDCRNFPGLDATFLRVAVKNHGENLRLLTALKEKN